MSSAEEPTLYAAIGGADGVEDIVSGLYRRTMADPTLAPFFAASSVDAIVGHQRELIAGALGGPAAYQGRTLRDAHAGMAITPDHFASLTAHLVDALRDAGVAQATIDRVTAVISRLWLAQQWPTEPA